MYRFRALPFVVLPFLGTPALATTQGAQGKAATTEATTQKSGSPGFAGLRDAIAKASEIKAALSQPIAVNGQPLDSKQVDRQMIYLVGQRQMREKMISLLIDNQIKQAIASGQRKEADFKVLEDEVTKSIDTNLQTFEKQNPGKKFWTELKKTNTTPEEYKTITRNTILFDKIFFPGIPAEWPDITKEAIIASGGQDGEAFWERFKNSVPKGQQVPQMWLTICRQWVINKLQEWSDVRYASDGLPTDVCMSVDGVHWKTDDAARALALKLKPEDRERALIEIVLANALRAELERHGSWLSDEEFRSEFEKYSEPYAKTPFTVKVMALSFKGYPSFEAYKQRWRIEKSFERMIAKEINDDNLGKHLERAKAFLADGRVSVQLIRVPAFDDSAGTWKSDGFAEARAKAEQIMADLSSGKVTFDAAFKEYAAWPEQNKDQGSLMNKSLNELRTELRENEYTDFVAGYSIGEILFYEVQKADVAGPFRGQDGYYIGRVIDRAPPTGGVSLADKNQRDLVKQDYLSHRFIDWANEIARSTVVR